ncbi:Protein of unknown function [Flavobacterium omnivorum]|uniref:DUF1493 family protein n=2 Tax=Flavobacterium omnivorum TaxID=178355 RepID=A0A1G8FQ78_9FLAO|nr:Protein of unknown function [Flavobacterium omnivorum]
MIVDLKQHKMKTIIKNSFKDLKQNYIEMQQFLEDKSGEKNINNKSKVANDLSLLGDDNYDMLKNFITKYNIDFSDFKYDEHFESEGELFSSASVFLTILLIPLYFIKIILFLIFKPFSKSHSKTINDFNFFIKEHKSNKIDLTMGDLITFKIQGKFSLRENVKFVLN